MINPTWRISSAPLKIGAIAVASGLHAAAAVFLFAHDRIEMEGTAAASEARIGSSFKDMAVGTLTAAEPDEIAEPVAPPLNQAEDVPDQATVPEPDPIKEGSARDQIIQPPAPTVPENPLPAPIPKVTGGTLALQPSPETILSSETLTMEQPTSAAVQPVEKPTPNEVIQSNPDSGELTISKRPMLRDPKLETPVKPEAKPTRQASRQAPKPEAKPKTTPRGNAQQNGTRGSTSGQKQASAAQKSTGTAKTKAQGNAAANNFPGLVNRHLARIRKPRMNRSGNTDISFVLDASGRISSISVVRSSGHQQVDRAALNMIRRAAPFPKPPPGAQRRFSILIEID